MTHEPQPTPSERPLPTIDLKTIDRGILDEYAQLHFGASKFDNLDDLGQSFLADILARDAAEGRNLSGGKIRLGDLGM